jgi:hypothetical protein
MAHQSNAGPEIMPRKPEEPLSLLFFFPEVIGAAACVVFSPWWCLRLARQGHVVYGGMVLLVAVAGTFGFTWFMVKRMRWATWVVIGAIVFAFLLLNATLPPADRFMTERDPKVSVGARLGSDLRSVFVPMARTCPLRQVASRFPQGIWLGTKLVGVVEAGH